MRPTFLKENGHEIIRPALADNDFQESVHIAQEALDEGNPHVAVRSSAGGAVAMNMDAGNTPLVLIAPSWKKRGIATRIKAATIILHSAHDDVVPVDDSRELLRQSGLPQDRNEKGGCG